MSKNPASYDLVHHGAHRWPEAVALTSHDTTWTYAALHRAVGATARRLRERGMGAGTRVAVHAARSPAAVVATWALWRVGAIVVPMSRRWPVVQVVRAAERVQATIALTDEEAVRDAFRDAYGDGAVHRLQAVVAWDLGSDREAASPSPLAPTRDATIVFTSGTTGVPNGVLHTWRNHVASAVGANANIPVTRGDRWLLSLPLYHVGGLSILVRCALGGATVVLPSDDAPLHETLADQGVTHASLVATQLRRLLRADADHPASMAALLVGGGPVPFDPIEAAHVRGWPIHTTYGCTEMASQVTTTPPGASLDTLSTSGRILPHRRLRIADDGEILVAGATLCAGYAEDDAVDDPRDANGWYPTGDLGRLDAQGRLRVEGRKDHMFVSGGENVQPESIEDALTAHPEVAAAVVVPVADDEFGHRPVAFVRTTGASVSTDVLRAHCRSILPAYMVPDHVLSLPESAEDGMKVDRRALQEHARRHVDA